MIERMTGGLRPQNGPWVCSSCDAYFFLVSADRQTLQSRLDGELNSIAGWKRFAVLVDAVAITFQSINDLQSSASQVNQRLKLAYKESAVWLLITDLKDNSIKVWIPYIFCSDPVALYTGRELYGFPKEFATINAPNAAGNFSVAGSTANFNNAMAEQPNVKDIMVARPLLSLQETVHAAQPRLSEDVLATLRQQRRQENAVGIWQRWGGFDTDWSRFVSLIISPSIDFVFARHEFDVSTQFWRSTLVLAGSPLTQHSFQSILQPYQFSLTQDKSHNMAFLLGLAGDSHGEKFEFASNLGAALKLKFELSIPRH
jgi:Acetoacetate decarboxylase (ADC)